MSRDGRIRHANHGIRFARSAQTRYGQRHNNWRGNWIRDSHTAHTPKRGEPVRTAHGPGKALRVRPREAVEYKQLRTQVNLIVGNSGRPVLIKSMSPLR